MKKNIILLSLILLTAVGCEDHSFRGQIDEVVTYYENLPVSILLGNADNDLLSKGSGAKDDEDPEVWKNAEISVYSFVRDIMASYKVTRIQDPHTCLIDASTERWGAISGKKARINTVDSYITWTGSYDKVIYYPKGNIPYEFFAYYTDDIEVPENDIVRTDNSIKMKLRIDGTQDLMTATAELTEEQLKPYRGQEMRFELANIMNYSYSAYTAERNINPVLQFKHHLTKLDFELHCSRAGADSVYVDSLALFSKTDGMFTVVDKVVGNLGADFSADDSYEKLFLREKDGRPLDLDKYHPPLYDPSKPPHSTIGTHIGGSLLVAPDKQYEAIVYATEYKRGDIYHSAYPVDIRYKPEGHFGPGNQYVVKLRVSGLQDIKADVELTEWQGGGDLIIDPEEEFEKTR